MAILFRDKNPVYSELLFKDKNSVYSVRKNNCNQSGNKLIVRKINEVAESKKRIAKYHRISVPAQDDQSIKEQRDQLKDVLKVLNAHAK